MEENKSVITNEFDRSGRYDAGLKALAKSLRAAFLLLLIGIIATLIYRKVYRSLLQAAPA